MLSAVAPQDAESTIRRICSMIKIGGLLFYRDYYPGDHSQLRFGSGHRLGENYHRRSDGTTTKFWDENELTLLFEQQGMRIIRQQVVVKEQVNRQTNMRMDRKWLQLVLKKESDTPPSSLDEEALRTLAQEEKEKEERATIEPASTSSIHITGMSTPNTEDKPDVQAPDDQTSSRAISSNSPPSSSSPSSPLTTMLSDMRRLLAMQPDSRSVQACFLYLLKRTLKRAEADEQVRESIPYSNVPTVQGQRGKKEKTQMREGKTTERRSPQRSEKEGEENKEQNAGGDEGAESDYDEESTSESSSESSSEEEIKDMKQKKELSTSSQPLTALPTKIRNRDRRQRIDEEYSGDDEDKQHPQTISAQTSSSPEQLTLISSTSRRERELWEGAGFPFIDTMNRIEVQFLPGRIQTAKKKLANKLRQQSQMQSSQPETNDASHVISLPLSQAAASALADEQFLMTPLVLIRSKLAFLNYCIEMARHQRTMAEKAKVQNSSPE